MGQKEIEPMDYHLDSTLTTLWHSHVLLKKVSISVSVYCVEQKEIEPMGYHPDIHVIILGTASGRFGFNIREIWGRIREISYHTIKYVKTNKNVLYAFQIYITYY